MTIAVDFDGTIVSHEYPAIGEERPFAVETLKMLIRDHHKLVLWSVREGKLLDEEHTDIMLAPNACGLRTLNGWYYADSGIEQAQSALYINAQYGVSAAMLANAPSAKEDADETGAKSFVQRMRYEMDDVYLKAEDVQLERINDANVYSVLKLAVNEDQQEFVAGNDISLAEAAALASPSRMPSRYCASKWKMREMPAMVTNEKRTSLSEMRRPFMSGSRMAVKKPTDEKATTPMETFEALIDA